MLLSSLYSLSHSVTHRELCIDQCSSSHTDLYRWCPEGLKLLCCVEESISQSNTVSLCYRLSRSPKYIHTCTHTDTHMETQVCMHTQTHIGMHTHKHTHSHSIYTVCTLLTVKVHVSCMNEIRAHTHTLHSPHHPRPPSHTHPGDRMKPLLRGVDRLAVPFVRDSGVCIYLSQMEHFRNKPVYVLFWALQHMTNRVERLIHLL